MIFPKAIADAIMKRSPFKGANTGVNITVNVTDVSIDKQLARRIADHIARLPIKLHQRKFS
jgi:hypothetical protein